MTLKNKQLVVERDGFEIETVPVEDIGVLILDNREITASQALLSACFEANVAVIVCDYRHMPSGIFMPLEGNNLHSKTLAGQISADEPSKKRLWQNIISAKIRAQAKTLALAEINTSHLLALSKSVKSGDPENIEAQAARHYWQRLFGPDFRRDADAPGINTLLNYGYAIMRAAVARSIVGAGLHPALGIHHRNQYNAFALADDMMEPFRPSVDYIVRAITKEISSTPELTPSMKREIIKTLGMECVIGGRTMPLIPALNLYAASVRKTLLGESRDAEIPEA